MKHSLKRIKFCQVIIESKQQPYKFEGEICKYNLEDVMKSGITNRVFFSQSVEKISYSLCF